VVDAARMPVYLTVEGRSMLSAWPTLAIAIAGVLLGTFWGVRLLPKIEERTFRRLLFVMILFLGAYMLVHAARQTAV
jgi:uncharacterized protein